MRFLRSIALLLVTMPAAAADKLPNPGDSTWYGGGPYRVAAADFTGDGIPDRALVYNRIGLLTIQKGDGQGGFTHLTHVEFDVPKPSEISGVFNLEVGDVDGDGRLDIACTPLGVPPSQWKDQDVPDDQWSQAHRGNAVLVRNLGNGRFEIVGEYPTRGRACGVNLSDLDRDGHLDLLYTARGSGYKGDLKLGVLNADGHLDAVTANYRERSISVLLGKGDGTFQDAVTTNRGYLRQQRKWYSEE